MSLKGNKNKKRGSSFEYRVKYYLEAEGYYVIRSYGSHGIFDLIAIAPLRSDLQPPALMVQCKFKDYLAPDERVTLASQIDRYDARVMVATRDEKRHIVFKDPRDYLTDEEKIRCTNVDNKPKCRLQSSRVRT